MNITDYLKRFCTFNIDYYNNYVYSISLREILGRGMNGNIVIDTRKRSFWVPQVVANDVFYPPAQCIRDSDDKGASLVFPLRTVVKSSSTMSANTGYGLFKAAAMLSLKDVGEFYRVRIGDTFYYFGNGLIMEGNEPLVMNILKFVKKDNSYDITKMSMIVNPKVLDKTNVFSKFFMNHVIGESLLFNRKVIPEIRYINGTIMHKIEDYDIVIADPMKYGLFGVPEFKMENNTENLKKMLLESKEF